MVLLEDNPIFNAGTGAVLNFDGFCELDACVMESRDSRVGAVSGLQRVRNPVLVARKVMEETDHVMLTGDGAQRFARVMGFPDHDPVTPERRADWFDKRNRIDEVLGARALKMRRFLKEHPEYAGGTVGAAAVDASGVLAAATSTGGVTLKMVGRVGDSPVPGAGNYASRSRRGLGHRHRRVRAALARHARDRRARGAGSGPRGGGGGRPRPPGRGLRRRRGAHRRRRSPASPWPCTARATCRTPSSPATSPVSARMRV